MPAIRILQAPAVIGRFSNIRGQLSHRRGEAFEVLLVAGEDTVDLPGGLGLDGLVLGACDWLGSVAAPVPFELRVEG
jgi:hypothetical protein